MGVLSDTPVVHDESPPLDHGARLLAIYDDALPRVVGYLRNRCETLSVAHELSSETFLAAVGQIKGGAVDEVTVPWLIGIARHKLVDHWRRSSRSGISVDSIELVDGVELHDDPWDAVLDQHRVSVVMHQLGDHHRSALTLRYVDGLPVNDVAHALGRTVHATEALLVRARRAFRTIYEGSEQ
jgi:RNA polymerase sigma-70 factor, ECF subfamily